MDNVSVEDHPRDGEGRFKQVYAPGESMRDRLDATKLSPLSRYRSAEAKKEAFLTAFAQMKGRKMKACQAANVDRQTIDYFLENDSDFADRFFEVQRLYVEEVEDRLDSRSQGEKGMPGVVATLAILHAEDPGKYKQKGVVGGEGGELRVTVRLEPQPLPQWDKPQLPEKVARTDED
jgi:hypothetical protein